MMKVTVLCIGKLKESYWREACSEYAKRLSAWCKFTIVELPESRLPENPAPAQIERALEEEGERLLSRAGNAESYKAALCIEGKLTSSEGLAEDIAAAALAGKSELVFLIGSSYGLSPRVKATVQKRLSMSPMTFPHQLARVMLCEQIYRAFQINKNGKYHK